MDLKLGTRQTEKPRTTQTKHCTYHRLKTAHKMYNTIGPGNSKDEGGKVIDKEATERREAKEDRMRMQMSL